MRNGKCRWNPARRTAAAVSAIAIIAALPAGSAASAPRPARNACVSLDAKSPAWQAIRRQYARLAGAMRRKDIDTLLSLYAPDFRVKMETGEVWSRARSLEYQRNGLKQVIETQHISNTILDLRQCGNHAEATVLQQWYRTQRMFGSDRKVETNTVQDESWTLTPAGWLRGNIENIRQGASFIDGRRVDITRPYDPEAPAFDPDDPARTLPVADALRSLIRNEGARAAVDAFPSIMKSGRYYQSEAGLNALGYELLGQKRSQDAIEIFRLVTSLYPSSANAFDSLGEAYAAAGQIAPAVSAYRRSLELDPHNDNARAQIQRLAPVPANRADK
jgi:tetratricopeptide (TPR) repeat protein